MAETVLAEWEGALVSVHEANPAAVSPSGLLDPTNGRIVRVGSDGFILQPAGSSPGQEDPRRLHFYPWHAVRLVERFESQG